MRDLCPCIFVLSEISIQSSSVVYAVKSSDKIQENIYPELRNQLRSTSTHDKHLLGDFNARVCCHTSVSSSVIVKHSVGKANSNGYLLPSFCSEHGLLITNTTPQLPNRHKTSWRHLRSNHYHLIDSVIVRFSSRKDVKMTRSFSIGEY